MDMQLEGKRAFVSGSSKGIGLAIASSLAREGSQVVINGRSEKSVGAALAEIRKEIPAANVEGFVGDLATSAAAETLGARIPGDLCLQPAVFRDQWRCIESGRRRRSGLFLTEASIRLVVELLAARRRIP